MPLSLRLPLSCRSSLSRSSLALFAKLRLTTAATSQRPTLSILEAPTLEEFQTSILPSNAPCLLRSCITHWPALARWTDLSNLKGSEAAHKSVPIEVVRIAAGETVAAGYNAKGTPGSSWDRIEMPLDVFLDGMMLGEEAGLDSERWAAYLAQYPLLDEAPSLRKDVSPPLPYVKAGRGDAWPTNMWIGTAGTFTPVHKDPYHNIFCQIVGHKHVSIYPPSASEDLYISTDPLQRNTSLLPSPTPDPGRFPRFARAQAVAWEADVRAGEVLFIPRGFFHSVRSVTRSVSVNSWFL